MGACPLLSIRLFEWDFQVHILLLNLAWKRQGKVGEFHLKDFVDTMDGWDAEPPHGKKILEPNGVWGGAPEGGGIDPHKKVHVSLHVRPPSNAVHSLLV